MRQIFIAAMIMAAPAAFAQLNQTNQCPPTATNCTGSNQNSGDTSTTVNNGDTHSTTSQLGNSSASNVSGNNVGFDNRAQTTQNANNTTTGTISGGNTNSQATGGSATGNKLDNNNDNRSSVGNVGSSSGGNSINNHTGLNGGNNTATNTATGGKGGSSYSEGGKGGNSYSSGKNEQGQEQGIDRSGNSANSNLNGQGQGQQQANHGTNAQGQSSTNRLSNGSSSSSGSNSGGNSMSNGSSSSSGSTSSSTSGGNTLSNGSSSGGNSMGQSNSTSNDGSGNSSTHVDASDRSVYNNKTIFIPPIIPPTPPSQLAVGNVVKETSACGPLQRVVEREVNGTFHGLFVNSDVKQGYHQELAPYLDDNGNEQQYKEVPLPTGDGYRVYGHQVTQYTTIVGVSGARNIAIGGGGSNGNWGQGGMGTSSANQQLVTTLQLRLCELGTVKAMVPQIVSVPVFVEVEKKPKKN